jgi:ribosomal protein S18 acetylase RimI-like enzyme
MDGKPVATNLAFNGGGVTGLFCIATLPDYRGRGIGAAVTLAPLYEADADAQYAVLFSSKSGKPVYERVGFREVGINIGRYVWYAD